MKVKFSYYFWIAIVSIFRFWLNSPFPARIIPNSFHDDAHFVQQASFLSSGHWLGGMFFTCRSD